jgi:hypothetical protein
MFPSVAPHVIQKLQASLKPKTENLTAIARKIEKVEETKEISRPIASSSRPALGSLNPNRPIAQQQNELEEKYRDITKYEIEILKFFFNVFFLFKLFLRI